MIAARPFRFLLVPVLVFCPMRARAADLYVATDGLDSNLGTQIAPLRTILKASQKAEPGTVIHVAAGSYAGGFRTSVSGSAAARIRYESEVKWGARIRAAGSARVIWDNRGSYTEIVGFEIDGAGNLSVTGGIYIGGSYNTVRGNHVHDIATTVPCNSAGGSAIGTDHYYGGIKDDVIGNVVHHIGSPGCRFVQGIYISTSGEVTNNLVYQVGAAAIHLWHDASRVNILNNTVFASGSGIIVGGGDFYSSTTRMADDCNVYNNIVFDNDYGISEQGTTGPNNTYVSNLVFQSRVKDWDLDSGKVSSGSIAADPQFVAYQRDGGGDYHLKPSSPGIDYGSARFAPATDLDGLVRPQGRGLDLGAYELPTAARP